jgi:disulfide bond formation protein DsbB
MNKKIYFLYFLTCFFLLGFALFLQHQGWEGVHYPPCPLCIFQRIGFLGIGFACLLAFFIRPMRIFFHWVAILFSVFGLGVALRHAWVIHYPETSCGVDPLEVFINQFSIVNQLSFFFKADGFCSLPLPPVFGLSIPQWSLLFFIGFSLSLSVALLRKSK